MEIRRLTGTLGAIIEGVDLETIDDPTFDALLDALIAHQVVFLRDQQLSEDGHRSLAGRFGTPTVYPVMKHLGGTEYLHVIEDTAESPPDADDWHTDITWVSGPPIVAILAALVIPSSGVTRCGPTSTAPGTSCPPQCRRCFPPCKFATVREVTSGRR